MTWMRFMASANMYVPMHALGVTYGGEITAFKPIPQMRKAWLLKTFAFVISGLLWFSHALV